MRPYSSSSMSLLVALQICSCSSSTPICVPSPTTSPSESTSPDPTDTTPSTETDTQPAPTASPSPSPTQTNLEFSQYDGVFFNIETLAIGTWLTEITIENGIVTGSHDASQFLTATTTKCGAGEFQTDYLSSAFSGSFVSHDTDPGCGYDHGAIFAYSAVHAAYPENLVGTYAIENSGGSNIVETDNGLFEVWLPGAHPIKQVFVGTFTNTNSGLSGIVDMELAVGSSLVFGYINFSELEGQTVLCGAGEFSGQVEPDSNMIFAFESYDTDDGCGFDHGNQIRVALQLAESGALAEGFFYSGDNASPNGYFEMRKAD